MENDILTPEQVDYLREMMNIGAGNSATAMESLLRNRFEMHMPEIKIIEPHKVFSSIDNPVELVTCVKMGMIGDIKGEIFFIVPHKMINTLIKLAEDSSSLKVKEADSTETSIIEEIGNILAGVYLTAIHDFCRLNIYHTIPLTAQDMAQAVLDETIARMGLSRRSIIIIINKFSTARQDKEYIDTYLILIPEKDSEIVLLNSVKEAMKICGR